MVMIIRESRSVKRTTARRGASHSPERSAPLDGAENAEALEDMCLATCGCVFAARSPSPRDPEVEWGSDGLSDSASACESSSCPSTESAEVTEQQRALWATFKAHGTSSVPLQEQIFALRAFLSLDAAEQAAHETLRQSVQRAVRSIWPTAEVKPWGMSRSGLALPDDSLELVVECEAAAAYLGMLCNAVGYEGMGVTSALVLPDGSAELRVATAACRAVVRLTHFDSHSDVTQAVAAAVSRCPNAAAAAVAVRVLLGQAGVCGEQTALTPQQVTSAVVGGGDMMGSADSGEILLDALRRCRDQGLAAFGVPAAGPAEGMLRAISRHYVTQIQNGAFVPAVACKKGLPFWGRSL